MNRTRRHWILIAGVAVAIGSGAALGQAAITRALDATLPDARGINLFNRPGTITLLSSNGKVIQKLGPATREKIKPGQMPQLVMQSFIAAEDRRFFDHDGVDLWGIGRAVVTNLKQGSVREGASTITQQLARTVFLSQDRTVTRKLKEAALAYKLERQLSKGQILEQYLNFVYLGSSAYGISDAAWVYFSKQPEELTLPEAALIAGMPPAPSLDSPLVNPEIALQRRSIVISRMEQEGFITSGEAEAARNSPLALKPAIPKYYNSTAPYFTTWVAQQLPTLLTPEQLEVGGLKIRTSLNLDWQRKAQKVVREIAPTGTEGVIVSIAPGTGLVRVMVGGKNFYSSQFNRATQALRSPGSTFKLFPYSAAINAGVKPEDIFLDKPRCWNGYCPKNFGKKYFGNISLADALKNSLNTVAVQLQDKVGFDPIIETNRGVYVKPTAFEEIRGPGGDVLWSRRVDGDRGKRAMDSDVADTMNWMLQRVVSGGTGIAAKLDDRPVAGKTGTSEGGRDIWFIGSIPQLTTAVWFGHDNNAETKSNSGESAWAWKQFMTQVKSEFPAQKFPAKPKTVRPVLQRPGKKKASDPNKPTPGDGPLPDRDLFGETDDPPAPTPRYVSPSGGPPVDEFFRPLPVQ